MKKAYGFFDVKSVDEDKRIITGVASTITPDRVEDIMEVSGIGPKTLERLRPLITVGSLR